MNSDETRHILDELMADASLGQLSPEDRAKFEAEIERADAHEMDEILGRLILAFDEAAGDQSALPAELKNKVQSTGQLMVGGNGSTKSSANRIHGLTWLLAAACVAIVATVSIYALSEVRERDELLDASNLELAALQEKIQANQTTLADARSAQRELETQLAEASEARLQLAEQLASATSDLDSARLAIARYEQPVDPEELKMNRQKLLEVPNTVRVAWQPFDLPDAPAEQQLVQGDVVWNNELQQGYLRFEGLAVNDPEIEQYQVWVIDERGMEQKVSGGVFNATADGEIIVPIEPGIDVGRVAVFAVTVEDPGGTWVPDLSRRVVVAPTGEG